MDRSIPSPPVVSALLCGRDDAEALGAALESLCCQTLDPSAFEVVVVDDGSTDGTAEVIRAFEARLPLRCARQRPAGMATARNLGLFLARGTIVVFLDHDAADPALLARHLETHRRFPEPWFGVLGDVRLAKAMCADPLMRFVTEVAALLFSSQLPPGELLDFSHFAAGRSSCKRSFLVQHGVFNRAFRSGGEDLELAYRLSRHGFKVVHDPRATTTVSRRLGVDDVCERLYERGRANVLFGRIHPDAALERRADVAQAREEWRRLAPVYDAILRSAHELDGLVRVRQLEALPIDELTLSLLHRSYWAAFRASEVKGIVDAAAEAPIAAAADASDGLH